MNNICNDVAFVFIFFLCMFSLTNCGFDTSEAINHYQVAKNFVATWHIGFDHPREGIFTIAPNGFTYGSHEFGNTLLLIPTAFVNHAIQIILINIGCSEPSRLQLVEQFLVSFQACVYSALTMAMIYLILTREYGHTMRIAFKCTILIGFGTYFWNYSRSLYDGVLCSTFLMLSVWYLLRYRRSGSLIYVWLAYSIFGMAVDTRISMIIPATVGFVYVLLACISTSKWKALFVALIALAPFAFWQLWYNNLRTGNLLLSPVQTEVYAGNNALDGNLFTGLVGLIISPGKGILVYSPLLLISVIALPQFWRKDRLVAGFVLATGIFWFLLHAKLRSWYGAWGWGPRHMVTVIPILCLPALVQLPEIWNHRLWRPFVSAVIFAGFVLASAATVGNYHYRMELACRQGRMNDDEFVWGWRNQSIDMLIGFGRNIAVVTGVKPPIKISEASELNNFASNRINVWWFTLQHAGVPWPIVFLSVCGLVIPSVWTALVLLRSPAK